MTAFGPRAHRPARGHQPPDRFRRAATRLARTGFGYRAAAATHPSPGASAAAASLPPHEKGERR
jgi:hypothetical protein